MIDDLTVLEVICAVAGVPVILESVIELDGLAVVESGTIGEDVIFSVVRIVGAKLSPVRDCIC